MNQIYSCFRQSVYLARFCVDKKCHLIWRVIAVDADVSCCLLLLLLLSLVAVQSLAAVGRRYLLLLLTAKADRSF